MTKTVEAQRSSDGRARTLGRLGALLALAGCALCAQGAAAESNEAEAADVTVVTADSLTFDHEQRYAIFDKNVVVNDPRMKLTSEQLTLRFNEEGEASLIEAEGKVVLLQDDKRATAGKAVYDVLTGKIVLRMKPRVERGKDYLEGDVITFWRDENRMVCQPNARLVITPQSGTAPSILRQGN